MKNTINFEQIPECLHTRLIPANGKKIPMGGKQWNKKTYTLEALAEKNPEAVGVMAGVLPDETAGILILDYDDCEDKMPDHLGGWVVRSPRGNSCKVVCYLESSDDIFELLQKRVPKTGRTPVSLGDGKLEIFWGESQTQAIVAGKHPHGLYNSNDCDPTSFDRGSLLNILQENLLPKKRVGKVIDNDGFNDRDWDLMVAKKILKDPKMFGEQFANYGKWLQVLMALKHTGERDNIEDVYEKLAHEWSQRAPNYHSYEAFEKQWNAIQNNHSDEITLATLIYTAEKLGVKVPKKQPKVKVVKTEDLNNIQDAVVIRQIINREIELDPEHTSPDYLFLQEVTRIAVRQQLDVLERLPKWDDSWDKKQKKAWFDEANTYPVLSSSFRQACLENIVFNGATFQFEFKQKRGEEVEFDRILELGSYLKNCRLKGFFGKGVIAHPAFPDEVAKKNRYYPQQLYAKSLLGTWDGVDRLKILFNGVLKVETEFQKKMVLKWLKGTTERWLEPSCKFDHILILQGSQGIGKTSFFEALAIPGMFTTLEQLHSKDDYLALHRNSIIELGEIDFIFRKQDVSKLKGAITKAVDLIRIPYGKSTHEFPRAFTLCGSVNNPVFLNDDTGSRRFFVVPIDTSRIDWKWVKENRDRIWAQVMELDIISHLDPEEQQLVEENNHNFKVQGTVEPLVETVIHDRTAEQLAAGVWDDRIPLSTNTIFNIIVEREKLPKVSRDASMIKNKIPDIMTKLGFKQCRMLKSDVSKYHIAQPNTRVWKLKN